jgi:hypothetical protein
VGFTPTKRDNWLQDLDTEGPYASLHTADPGTTGADEVTGGTPAYARKALTWAASSGGSKGASLVTFDVGAGTTVTHFGLWSAVSGGTFLGGSALPAPEVYGSQGTLAVSITATATTPA